MNVELDPDLDKTIGELLLGGGYHSRQEVIREAIELLKSREASRQENLERLRRDIQSGIDQIDRGEVFDAEEVFEELLQGLPNPEEPDA
ncbi:MAG TPA: ribbon-helix-helix protein, CopG family [Pirellulales bacterium]|nr:ribbon-helix-helix protein, CopG family [Pirellulales bacterium]